MYLPQMCPPPLHCHLKVRSHPWQVSSKNLFCCFTWCSLRIWHQWGTVLVLLLLSCRMPHCISADPCQLFYEAHACRNVSACLPVVYAYVSLSQPACCSAAEVFTAQSSEHSLQSELSDLMSARQEWHATLDDVLEGTHDDLEAIMISARYPAIHSAVTSRHARLAPSLCLQGTAFDWFASCMLLL